MNWRRWGLVVGAGAAAVLAAAVPVTAVVTVPVLGHLSAAAGLGALATFLGGWAMRTPGHGPVDPAAPKP